MMHGVLQPGATSTAPGTGAAAGPDRDTFWGEFRDRLNRRRWKTDALVNIFILAACLGVLGRWQVHYSIAGLLSISCYAAAEVASIYWKAMHLDSYLRWREPLAAAMIVASMAIDGAWEPIVLGFNSERHGSLWGGGPPASHLKLLVLLLWGSGCLSVLLISLGRPLRLWLHLPTQALVLLAMRRRVPEICATAALQHPAVEGLLQSWYTGLSLLLLAPVSPIPFLAHQVLPAPDAAGRCEGVAGMLQWLCALVAPTLALAALERAELRQHEAAFARRWRREREGAGAGAGAGAPRERWDRRRACKGWPDLVQHYVYCCSDALLSDGALAMLPLVVAFSALGWLAVA